MDDEEIFDVIVVGGGVAGAVCAYRLATAGRQVVLIERGAEPGSKNLSGGVFYCRVMEQVFPGFVDRAPVERRITRNVVSFLNATSAVNIDYWDARLADPVNAVAVLRAKLDAQEEIRVLCDLMWPHMQAWAPEIAGWYEKSRLHKARLAP